MTENSPLTGEDQRKRNHPDAGEISVELSSRRTGMSFQRTRLSADRTLMSVIRTSLSLITFGFTVFQFFKQLTQASILEGDHAPRSFGIALVVLGVALLVMGIVYHIRFMIGLREERNRLSTSHIIHGESRLPPSMTLVTVPLLLVIGLAAISNMLFGIVPFG